MPIFPSDVEYREHGEGPPLLLLPGSFGTGAGWKPVIDKLARSYRIVTTSLLGYGATAERRPPNCATMQFQTEVIDAILGRIGEPAHIAAHSFGGLAALAHAIDGANMARSLTLVEANPFGILRTANEPALYALFGAMTDVYFAEFQAQRPDAARHVIDFYGGDGAFAAFPQKVRDYVMKTTPSNIRDWSSGTAFEVPLTEYGKIEARTVVVRGGNGHPAMLRIAELIAGSIPNSRLETVTGGSHFLPATHPGDVARLIDANIAASAA